MVELTEPSRSDLRLVAEWLAQPENARWLDFGAGRRSLAATALAMMVETGTQVMRMVRVPDAGAPVAVASLGNIDREAGTATLWYVLGERRFGGRGIVKEAVRQLLEVGFEEEGLHAVHAWAVEGNHASIRILEVNGFRRIGIQRSCHLVDGTRRDRVLFDILKGE